MRVSIPYQGLSNALKIVALGMLLFGWLSPVDHHFCGYRGVLQGSVVMAKEAISAAKDSLIKSIEVSEQETEGLITIKTSQSPTYTVVKLKDPLRIVVDIPDFVTEKTIAPLVVKSTTITEITNQQIEKGERKFCRIEIGLTQDVEYEVTTVLNDLVIRVARPTLTQLKEARAPKEAKEVAVKKASKKIIDVAMGNNLNEVTILSDSELGAYTAFVMENPYRVVVDIPGVEYLVSKDISSFRSALMEKVKVGLHAEKVRFVFYFKNGLPTYQVEKDGNKLQVKWEVPVTAQQGDEKVTKAKKVEETKEGEKVVAEVAPVKEEKVKETVKEVEVVPGGLQESTIFAEGEKTGEAGKVYTGQKISLDFKDADIRNILRLIADISGLNIIVSENVKGKVTIKLENIPWDQVLDIILETNNLGKLWMGDVLRIETQAEIKRISDEKYNAQKSREKVADLKTEVVDIIYRDAKDVSELLTKEKELTSDRGAISVDPNLNRIIVTDTPEKIDKIKEKIARYDDTTVRQVYIEARVVQSIPTFTKEMGIQWGGPYSTTGNSGKTVYGVGGAGGVTFEKEEVTDPITGLTTEVLKKVISNGNMIDLPAPAGPATGGAIGFGILRKNLELTATLSAMEKDEKLKIISNPRVLSIDKNEAIIKQGVALPYLKLSEEGVTSTEFKDAVLELKVTPTILSPKIVKIEIKVKKNQKSAQTGAGGEPGIDVREAQTVLMVENGRTVVIGGIYEETVTTIRSGVPFFSGIPGVGRLFRNDYNKKELTELLIFLTTTIVPKEIIGAGM